MATLSSGAFGATSEVKVIGPLASVGKYGSVRVGSSVTFGAIVGLAFIGGFGVLESDV